MARVQSRIIPKGQTFVLTSGSYSDFEIDGVYRAMRDVALAGEIEDYLAVRPEEDKRYVWRASGFISWLIAGGAIAPVELDWWEVHMGDYEAEDTEVSDRWL